MSFFSTLCRENDWEGKEVKTEFSASLARLSEPGDSFQRNKYAISGLELRDQYDGPQGLTFPATNVVVLTIADKKGSEQIDHWVAVLKARYAGRIELRGLADVGGVPGFLRGKVRKKFQETRTYPVMMDWSGKTCAGLGYQAGAAHLVIFSEDGEICGRVTGPATSVTIAKLEEIVAKATRLATGSKAPQ